MEEACDNQIKHNIVFHTDCPEGTVFYPNVGRPCPDCECFFMNSYDYKLHRSICRTKEEKIRWHKNADGSEWYSSNSDPALLRQLEINGTIVMDRWKYTLSLNKKWFYRKPAP